MPRVALLFHGSVVVDIDVDPEDVDAWSDAVYQAWCAVSPQDVWDAAKLETDEIVEPDVDEGPVT